MLDNNKTPDDCFKLKEYGLNEIKQKFVGSYT